MSNKEELLKKIKNLAERGNDGEKASAQQMLENLMKKYDISEHSLETKQVKIRWFKYHDDIEARLLSQIIYTVTGRSSFGCVGATNRKRKQRGIECTAVEHLEIEANYSFYTNAIKEDLEMFFIAFVNKNDLFPSEDKNTHDEKVLTPEEKEKHTKAMLMSAGMERRTLRKLIGEHNDK